MQWTKCITGGLPASWRAGQVLVRHLSVIAAIVALSVSCGSELPTAPTPPTTPTPPPPTFTLTGTVMAAFGEVRTPARNVAVEISQTQRAVTDSAGNFSIFGLASGAYALQVTAFMYQPLTTTVSINGDTRIELEIVPTPVFALSGIVYEDTKDGSIPVPGVYVNNSEIHDSTRTDATGAYRVLALRGAAYILFSKSGYVDQGRAVVMEGDVRLDVKLVRR